MRRSKRGDDDGESLFDEPPAVVAAPPPVYALQPFAHLDLEPEVRSKMLAAFCNHRWQADGDKQTCVGLCRITLPRVEGVKI